MVRSANVKGNFLDGVNFNRISEDAYLEVKMLKDELAIDEMVKRENRAFAQSPATIDKMLKILELKYDEDEAIQAQKQKLLKCMSRLNHRKLVEEYVQKLGRERDSLQFAVSHFEAIMDSRRAPKTIKTSTKIFDRLSKNVLQNVMSFFDYKGADFVKMRSINHKAKNSYMQEM